MKLFQLLFQLGVSAQLLSCMNCRPYSFILLLLLLLLLLLFFNVLTVLLFFFADRSMHNFLFIFSIMFLK
jgi:hypothetical protein